MKLWISSILICQTLIAQQNPSTTPTLTEVQQLKIQNLNQQITIIQLQAQQAFQGVKAQRLELISEIEKEHPGYHWHFAQAPGEAEGLQRDVKEEHKEASK